MLRTSAVIDMGSSSITLLASRKETLGDGVFRWECIKLYIYLSITYASSAYNFDVFSKVCENVRVIDFIIIESTIGISYMCMDSFIKQYTKRFDCIKYMNPLLRGISYGRFLQTSKFVVLHATYLADSLRFLVLSFREVPPWSTCQTDNDTLCIAAKDIMVRCNHNMSTKFVETSAYFNYLDSFMSIDRSTLTSRFFILGLVWMLVFFFASVTEETIVKIFKLTFMCRAMSTLLTLLFIFISTENVATEAFSQIVDIAAPSDIMLSVKHVAYAYGIGFLGIYDFGALSTYTMIDTASVFFVAVFTFLSFLRSWIVKILYITMTKCVEIEDQYSTHVLVYAILPLTTEFLYAHKLYVFYFYGNVFLSTLTFMTYLIAILAKFLSYEFRSVKQVYIVGLLCCLGLALSLPLLAIVTSLHRSFTLGIDLVDTYLGGAYVAIVMWLYGLKKFCTDIQFLLGFRPTRFWTISWALLPAALFCCTARNVYNLVQMKASITKYMAIAWGAITFAFVATINIKTMAGFLMRNNLAGMFKSHKNYGPPDAEDRKRRLYYSEFTRQRKCRHNCMVIDEWFKCNHQEYIPETTSSNEMSSSSDPSLMNVYEAKPTSRLRSAAASNTPAPAST
uniref:SFRICE_000353 n=1 Tax=Spodoptera frugiperda TaxID=7108 RepID=A0A2H1VGS9_SPOFR